jgi:hypothetical protein
MHCVPVLSQLVHFGRASSHLIFRARQWLQAWDRRLRFRPGPEAAWAGNSDMEMIGNRCCVQELQYRAERGTSSPFFIVTVRFGSVH